MVAVFVFVVVVVVVVAGTSQVQTTDMLRKKKTYPYPSSTYLCPQLQRFRYRRVMTDDPPDRRTRESGKEPRPEKRPFGDLMME
jgi:hypothetical protein